ncbi:MAG: T9SS C-terminal target domain-containing protein [Calditrichaeota bacterium]|nr:MAG: T9SS C-terminal target domain-containing protein [Calditrichota bacterium]MBL1204672.1 T9SS C-terminal target domain-containing protein [Calditrichota bacterium]NOG44500.1 T9SS type A sorting domain-containing protein [Calditrichota bacterium]
MRKIATIIFLSLLTTMSLHAQEQGNVLKFDGIDDYVKVAHNSSINISTDWTLEVWIKPDTITSSYQAILSKNRAPRPSSLWIRNGFAEIWFSVGSVDGAKLQGRIPFHSKEWTHLAATYNSSTLSLYVNGELDSSIALSILPDTSQNAWTFGQRGDDLFWFAGEMDEVRIWDIARSVDQINYYKDFNLRNDVEGLKGLWHFNDAVGAARVWEETQNKNHGSVFGAEIIDSISPVDVLPANSLYLNGASESVSIPHNPSLDISTQWTLEAWIKPDTLTPTYKAIISKNRVPRPPSLWIIDDKVEVWFETDSTGDAVQAVGTNVLKQNEWQHIAATYDSNFIRIFVNGKVDVVVESNLIPKLNTKDWSIGQRGDNLHWYGGYVDEVRIWNRALDQKEIQQRMLYTQGAANGLLGAWGFNQLVSDEVAVVNDNSGNESDGTVDAQALVDSDTPVDYFVTAIDPLIRSVTPQEFSLKQNYPNPFNPNTTIPFSLKKSGKVSLKIFDTLGRLVLDAFNKNISAGSYNINVDMRNLPSGTYFYQLKTAAFAQTKRMVLLR